MQKTLKKGDEIKNISKISKEALEQEGESNYGKIGVVTEVINDGEEVRIKYNDGCTGQGSSETGIDYQFIKEQIVNFLLQYELDEDPVEEFENLADVKKRIKELVALYPESLKKDRIYVYEVKKRTKVELTTTVTVKGI